MPWRETHAKFKQLTSLERIKGQTKVPCIIQDIDSRRGLEYQLDVRTGFSNFASSFDPRRPTEWAALDEEAAFWALGTLSVLLASAHARAASPKFHSILHSGSCHCRSLIHGSMDTTIHVSSAVSCSVDAHAFAFMHT